MQRCEKRFHVFNRTQAKSQVMLRGSNDPVSMRLCIVISEDNYLGLLSHQIVDGIENKLLVIPANIVIEWIKRILSSVSVPRVYFREGMNEQLLKQDSVKTEEASYDYQKFASFHHNLAFPTVKIQRFYDPYGFLPFRDPFGRLERMYKFLMHPKSHTFVTVNYIRIGSKLSRNTKLEKVRGLHDLFSRVLKSHSIPLFITPLGHKDWNSVIEFKKATLIISSLIKPISISKLSLLDHVDAIVYWLSQIPSDIENLNEDWTIVTQLDLEEALTEYKEDWKIIEEQDPRLAKELRKGLSNLVDLRLALMGF